MSVLRNIRWPFLAVFALCLTVALSSCSKKDVVSGEPAINPSGGAGGAVGTNEAGTNGSAGEAAAPSSVLKTVHFGFDSAALGSDSRSTLKGNAKWLKDNPATTVQIEGHCDQRGTVEYNLALGERRANSVRDYLARLGVDKGRMSTISYGKERPVDPGNDEAAWAKNRRAEFVILNKGATR